MQFRQKAIIDYGSAWKEMRCLGEGLGSNALRNSSYAETMSSASLKKLMVEKQKK
jgi:hypothetical protein